MSRASLPRLFSIALISLFFISFISSSLAGAPCTTTYDSTISTCNLDNSTCWSAGFPANPSDHGCIAYSGQGGFQDDQLRNPVSWTGDLTVDNSVRVYSRSNVFIDGEINILDNAYLRFSFDRPQRFEFTGDIYVAAGGDIDDNIGDVTLTGSGFTTSVIDIAEFSRLIIGYVGGPASTLANTTVTVHGEFLVEGEVDFEDVYIIIPASGVMTTYHTPNEGLSQPNIRLSDGVQWSVLGTINHGYGRAMPYAGNFPISIVGESAVLNLFDGGWVGPDIEVSWGGRIVFHPGRTHWLTDVMVDEDSTMHFNGGSALFSLVEMKGNLTGNGLFQSYVAPELDGCTITPSGGLLEFRPDSPVRVTTNALIRLNLNVSDVDAALALGAVEFDDASTSLEINVYGALSGSEGNVPRLLLSWAGSDGEGVWSLVNAVDISACPRAEVQVVGTEVFLYPRCDEGACVSDDECDDGYQCDDEFFRCVVTPGGQGVIFGLTSGQLAAVSGGVALLVFAATVVVLRKGRGSDKKNKKNKKNKEYDVEQPLQGSGKSPRKNSAKRGGPRKTSQNVPGVMTTPISNFKRSTMSTVNTVVSLDSEMAPHFS